MKLVAQVIRTITVLLFVFSPMLHASEQASIIVKKEGLLKHWFHSREEEAASDRSRIFRPSGYKTFPPSWYRQEYVFYADGKLEWLYLSPIDAHHFKLGQWWLDSEKENVIHFDIGERVESWEILELKKDLLRISRN